jgi:hypothetical protein
MGALHDTLPTRGLFMTEDGGAKWTRVIVPESASHRRHRRVDHQKQPGHHAGDDLGQDP